MKNKKNVREVNRERKYFGGFCEHAEGMIKESGGLDETRTRDLRRDRPAF